MTRAALLALSAVLLLACGDDAAEDGGGGGDTPTWVEGPGGRTFDASACAPGGENLEPLRCTEVKAPLRVALGLCGDLEADNTLDLATRNASTRDFALAVDGRSRIAAPLHITGSYVATGGLTCNNTIDVSGTLGVAESWTVSAPAHIGGDAVVEPRIEASNTITINGTLHTPIAENAEAVDAGATEIGEVDVTSALACADAIDIAALVAGFQGGAGIDRLPGDLLEHVDQPSTLDLGCGNYAISALGADNTLSIHVRSSTVLVVKGDLRVAAPMTIEVDADATLDLAIGGSLQIDNTLSISGNSQAIWVGVAGDIDVAAPFRMDGVLVAPRGDLNANNTVDISGALLAKNLHVAAPVHVEEGAWLAGTGCIGSE